ncbi:MAG: ABC transporter ATP-binding protein/permease [Spirochaetaceae bacterium]|jgi:ATP-binding cassette subfamily B protein|nr:ABC transporter ATP-binding protein/permease [Spirochaetaceae bacterium]
MFQLRWLWKYIGRRRRGFLTGLVIAAVSSFLVIINPMLSQRLIDEVIIPKNTEPLIRLLLIMMGVQLVRLLLRYWMVILMELKSTEVMTDVRHRMYDVVQGQDYRFLNRIRTGNLMTRMTSDLDMLRHTVAWISYQFVDAVVIFSSAIIFLLFVNWVLTLCLAAITPFILYLSRRFVGRIRPRFVLLRQKLTQLSTAVTENIDGNRVVKAFAREEYEKERFEQHNAGYRDTSYENAFIVAKYQPLLEAASQLLIVITLLVGGVFLIKGYMTPGQYLAFSSLTWALAMPLRMLAILLADLQRFNAAATMIIEVVNAEPGIMDRYDAVELSERPSGGIEFKNVSFSIDGLPILKDISFTVQPGETIGILGSTGAGKSSLINLILHFYEPASGEVLLDGVNIQRYTLSSLRRHIGLAMQDVFLFSDSVKGNIAYGRPEIDEEEIRKRAIQADADSFIRGMEQGYDTLIGERGVGLSGGQKQRISLARALAIRPSILILDDTTSAVDSETERYIQEELQNLDYPCTKIIIAQRLTSFRGAAQILVMDKGRIIERGTHGDLLKEKGFYHYIWSLQNNG